MDDTNAAARPDHERLFAIATEQAGYFTTAQARDCGFSSPLLSHHAKSGRFVRVARGLYRFRDYPSSPREELLAAWLRLAPEAVVSHESALELLRLSDIIPNLIQLSARVPDGSSPGAPGSRCTGDLVGYLDLSPSSVEMSCSDRSA